MKLIGDSIQFESRVELEELLKMIATYVSEHPNEKENDILKTFYNYIDVLDMVW